MFHLHNVLGLLVTVATFYTSFEMYGYREWSPSWSVHSILGLIALVLLLITFLTGVVTSGMMMWYNGD